MTPLTLSPPLRDNASPPKMSFYGNPCSRYITVRKALAHVLNELRHFRVLRVRIQDDRHKWKDQRTCRSYICRSCFDHFESDREEVVSERDAFTDRNISSCVADGPITCQSEYVCACVCVRDLYISIYIYMCVRECVCVCVCTVYMYVCSLYVCVCVCVSVCLFCLLNAISVIHIIIYR